MCYWEDKAEVFIENSIKLNKGRRNSETLQKKKKNKKVFNNL